LLCLLLGLNFVLETILVVFQVFLWGWCEAAQGLLHDWVKVIHRVRLSWLVVGETNHSIVQEDFVQVAKNIFARIMQNRGKV